MEFDRARRVMTADARHRPSPVPPPPRFVAPVWGSCSRGITVITITHQMIRSYTSARMTQGTIDQAMQLAVQHHQAGRFSEAQAIYSQVLDRQPDHADALHLLGVLACQAGQLDSGIEMVRRAIAINPIDANYYLNLASALHHKGDHDQVIAACQQA